MTNCASSLSDFDDVAEDYDRWYEKPLGRRYDTIEKEAIQELLRPPVLGSRLLEIGCGTGHWSEFFVAEGFRVTGIDLSRRMVQLACTKGIARASFAVADALMLPFKDGAFDLAVGVTALEFVTDPEKAVAEMVRCVRPGGRIIVGVLNRCSPLGRHRKAEGSPLYRTAHFFSVTELKTLLGQHGPCEVRAVAFMPRSRWLYWLAPVLEWLGQRLGWSWGDFLVGAIVR